MIVARADCAQCGVVMQRSQAIRTMAADRPWAADGAGAGAHSE
jgi:hypothetical protein